MAPLLLSAAAAAGLRQGIRIIPATTKTRIIITTTIPATTSAMTSSSRSYSSSSSSKQPPPPPSPPSFDQPQHYQYEQQPSPQRLPPAQQREWDELMRKAGTDQGFTPTTMPPPEDAGIAATSTSTSDNDVGEEKSSSSSSSSSSRSETAADGPLRKGAKPEFEGDTNPKTGEVGGPKNEPLRWGAGGDYSFNGRVTDF